MNKYIMKSKKTHQSLELEPLILEEYTIFTDKITQEKFMILKLLNNDHQTIHSIKFEIKQFNHESKLIQKADYLYENFAVEGDKHFVPFGKVAVDKACDTIKMKLISAKYESKRWINGEWEYLKNIPENTSNQDISNEQNPQIDTFVLSLTRKGSYFPFSISIVLFVLFMAIIILLFHLSIIFQDAVQHFFYKDLLP